MDALNVKCPVYDIEGVYNLRDLGGYRIGKKTTAKLRFIRSASLSGLTDTGKSGLLQLGVDCVVDLRSVYETRSDRDVISDCPDIRYENVPMLDNLFSGEAHGGAIHIPSSMNEMYIGILRESAGAIARVFDIFAGSHKTVLFHCTAGKDRTGIISMLLLGLAGAGDEIIIEDYAYTDILMRYKNRPPEIPDYMFKALPETMHETLLFIKESYGGIVPYLLKAGIPRECLDAVKAKLL